MRSFFDFYVVDMHTHLRNDIEYHTGIARSSGIDVVVNMANAKPIRDNLAMIKKDKAALNHCRLLQVSAITKGLKGKDLVNVNILKNYVVGFSDDGKCLKNLNLVREILEQDVLVMLHCEPETEYVEKYLNLLDKVGGRLHLQHISRKESIDVIRGAKKSKLEFTVETCPHYFNYTKDDIDAKVNPPLANIEDVDSVREALADNTIDVISSDYAPKPRVTGIAGFRSFLSLSYGLVLDKTLTQDQFRYKVSKIPSILLGIEDKQISFLKT